MKHRKLQVAAAAIALAAQLASPGYAGAKPVDLDPVLKLVDAGQVQELQTLLSENPDLLRVEGTLGGLLQDFATNADAKSLARIADHDGLGIAASHHGKGEGEAKRRTGNKGRGNGNGHNGGHGNHGGHGGHHY
jgi:hypothetical protein